MLSYAQHLHSDSAMWRITVTYMYTCGKIGASTADEILLGVPLRLQGKPSSTTEGGDNEIVPDKGDLSAIVKEVNATCHEYQREAVRRTVCRVRDVAWFLSQFSLHSAFRSLLRALFSKRSTVLPYPTAHRQKTGRDLVVWLIVFCKNMFMQVSCPHVHVHDVTI